VFVRTATGATQLDTGKTNGPGRGEEIGMGRTDGREMRRQVTGCYRTDVVR